MKRALIVVNSYKKECHDYAEIIKQYLDSRGMGNSFFFFSDGNKLCDFSKADFVVTLGGDGTVLFAARGCASYAIPIFPINLGHFGFIASIQKQNWQEKLELFLEKKLPIVSRSLVEACVFRDGKKKYTVRGFNDIVISAKQSARIVTLDLKFGGFPFGEFKADGIIVATATGSTAYSAAAGGPIIDPGLDVLLLNTVSPFSLSNRPLVLPPEGSLEVEILPSRAEGQVLTADGQITETLKTKDIIDFSLAKDKVLLAGCDSEHFYSALCSKLHWSGGPHA